MLRHVALTEVSKAALGGTELLTATATEADYLMRHVDGLAGLADDADARGTFTRNSGMPAALRALTNANAQAFTAGAEDLARRLHAAMAASTRASACLLAVASVTGGAGGDKIAILKLDMVYEGARVRRRGGRLSLDVMRELLPEPGMLQKGLMWPDPRPGSAVFVEDRNAGDGARYFRNAYDVDLGPRPREAEDAIASLLLNTPAAARAGAIAGIADYSGPVSGALTRLRQLNVPVPAAADLPRPLKDSATSVRPGQVSRRTVRYEADGIRIDVPLGREDAIDLRRQGDRWAVTVLFDSEPLPRVV